MKVDTRGAFTHAVFSVRDSVCAVLPADDGTAIPLRRGTKRAVFNDREERSDPPPDKRAQSDRSEEVIRLNRPDVPCSIGLRGEFYLQMTEL